ncbi:MAG TPA: DUF934 domain-containing protein [Burkholderiales bacterium]|nr:DUF934 domain-containing protein [Burkholderiales bacterium]
MATLIKEQRIVADSWRLLSRGPGGEAPELPSQGDVIVPLPLWLAHREGFLAYPGKLGVWLDANEGPEAIAGDLQRFALVAVNFPKFGDGRGYSTARLLRERYGYRGELRAIGDVLHDHLHFMKQCGFDAFVLREDQDAREALGALDTFSEGYQTSALRPLPLFRRRLAAGKP